MAEQLLNIASSNLQKEIILYYNNDKSETIIINNWWQNPKNKLVFKTFNLLKFNLLDNYQRVELLGSYQNFMETRTSWGNVAYAASKIVSDFNKLNLKHFITNETEVLSHWTDNKDNFLWLWLQEFDEKWGLAGIIGKQSIALNYYQKQQNGNYLLQVLIKQYATCWASSSGGSQFMGIGKGIRFYNDDNIGNQKLRRDIMLQSNINKWTSDFVKIINFTSNDSVITNKTNFNIKEQEIAVL